MANLKLNKTELAFLQAGLLKVFGEDRDVMKQIVDTVGEVKILETGMAFMKLQVDMKKGNTSEEEQAELFLNLLKKVFEVKEDGNGTKEA
ncbi:hypothetical protein [Bacillus phage YungSlug]|nr:hypothetical protein [Bacillus phage YungSlug]